MDRAGFCHPVQVEEAQEGTTARNEADADL